MPTKEAIERAPSRLSYLKGLEARISASDEEGLRARWEFGRDLVGHREGMGRLPNGYLRTICEAVGVSRAEVNRRMKFAEKYPTEEELSHAVSKFGSWHELVQKGLYEPRQQEPPKLARLEPGEQDPRWTLGDLALSNESAQEETQVSDQQEQEVEPTSTLSNENDEEDERQLYFDAGELPDDCDPNFKQLVNDLEFEISQYLSLEQDLYEEGMEAPTLETLVENVRSALRVLLAGTFTYE